MVLFLFLVNNNAVKWHLFERNITHLSTKAFLKKYFFFFFKCQKCVVVKCEQNMVNVIDYRLKITNW